MESGKVLSRLEGHPVVSQDQTHLFVSSRHSCFLNVSWIWFHRMLSNSLSHFSWIIFLVFHTAFSCEINTHIIKPSNSFDINHHFIHWNSIKNMTPLILLLLIFFADTTLGDDCLNPIYSRFSSNHTGCKPENSACNKSKVRMSIRMTITNAYRTDWSKRGWYRAHPWSA